MTDYTVGDTVYLMFSTRAFATGIPTVLAGTPVVSAYENDSVTQITAGITLGVSHDSVVGMNLLTVVATGGNGFETGKDYNLVITTGTVGGVSVVGEVVGTFSLGRSAAFNEIGTAGAGLSNINLPNQTMDIVGSITGNLSGSVGSVTGAVGSVTGAVGSVTAAVTVGTINANVITATSIAASALNGKGDWNIGKTGYSISGTITTLDGLNNFNPATDTVANVALTATTTDVTNDVTITAASVDLIWDEPLSGHVTGGTSGKALVDVRDTNAAVDGSVNDAGATASAFITNLTEATDNHYKDQPVTFTDGVLKGQTKNASGYVGATKQFTFTEPFTEAPGNGDNFVVGAMHVHPISDIADGVWDEPLAGHVTAGTSGKAVTDIDGKTSSLTYTVANQLDINIQSVNDVTVNGTGASGDEWGP